MALITLSSLFAFGMIVRHVQQRAVPVPVGAYDELDRLFFQRVDSALTEDASGDPPANPSGNPAEAASLEAQHPELGSGTAVRSGPVDINTAGAAELETLPRIGPTTAERIVTFRTTYGPFHSIDDLEQIRGIGPKTVDLLRPHVMVSSVTDATGP